MTNLESPCHYCNERAPGCHSTCQLYAQYKVDVKNSQRSETDTKVYRDLISQSIDRQSKRLRVECRHKRSKRKSHP